MARPVHIAVDVMGGDHGLRIALPAALASLRLHPDLKLSLVGDASAIEGFLASAGKLAARINVIPATQMVEMSDKPAAALRHKRQSSMRLALDALASGSVEAVVSAGNTGALMAMGLATVPPPAPIQRPAFCTRIPTRRGHCYLLDLGANVDSSTDQLLQFGLMGTALASVWDGVATPTVALLNIGSEAGKGNEQVRSAAARFAEADALNFVGFVEGDTLFDGVADVVVCDGFTGNIALKVCEGTASLIRERLVAQLMASGSRRVLGLLLKPLLASLLRDIDPARYSGAILLGLDGVVVKSHGNSGEPHFRRAIEYAHAAVSRGLLAAIKARLGNHSV